jgi:hypothetical protein
MEVGVGVAVSVGGSCVWVAVDKGVGVNGAAGEASICGNAMGRLKQPDKSSASNIHVAIHPGCESLGMG